MSGPARPAAVAGRFYPGNPRELRREVEAFLADRQPLAPRPAVGVVAPHAGYVYSGGVAGHVYADIEVPDRVVVLAPNHTGRGVPISVVPRGSFEVPGTPVPIDEELADRILEEVPSAAADWMAHEMEHAIEVHLPFLRARNPNVAVVPIVLAGLSEENAIAFGRALASAANRVEGDVLVVASSDMSHYLPDETARRMDNIALAPLLAADPHALYRTVRQHDISMCGFIPATAMLAYAQARGDADPPRLVDYATSGDAFGDRARVVGYAGVVVPRHGGGERE